MGISIDWGDYDENFVVITFVGKWSAEEFYGMMAQLSRMTTNADYGVELLVDMRNSINPPNNLMSLLRSILQRPLPPNIKNVVVISSSSFWNRIYSMIDSMYGDKIDAPVRFVSTVDEGYAALNFFQGMV